MKSYQAAINAVMWRQVHTGVMSVLLSVMINLLIVNHCRDFLTSLNAWQAIAIVFGLFALNGVVFFLVRRILRARRDEEIQRRLHRLQVWEVIKADRTIQQQRTQKREREKVAYGRQDI